MTSQQPIISHPEPVAGDGAEMAAKDTLAALLDLPFIDYDPLADLLQQHPDRYLVDTLPLLPDDGIGTGDATLHLIPANLYGAPDARHRSTWAVSVYYDHDGPGDYDLTICATEEEAREGHTQRIAARLADGCPDPNDEAEG